MGRQRQTKYILAWKKSGAFCQRNWNDPICIKIRDLLMKLTQGFERKTYHRPWIEIKGFWYADNNYYMVFDKENEWLFIITWYKSRGATEMILFQGCPCGKEQATHLLKLLQKEAKG